MVKDDSHIAQALQDKAQNHPEEKLQKAYNRLRSEGKEWINKRIHRIYAALGLPLRRKVKEPLEIPSIINHTWSIDFVTDVLDNKKRFRAFNVIDDYNREVLHIEIVYSLTSNRVIWVLNHLINRRGKP